MKRALIVLSIVIVVGLGLMVAAGLVARSMVSGSGKDTLARTIGERIGAPVNVESAEFDLAAWFRLKPAVALENVSIGNPAGFRGKHLLKARKLSAQVLLIPLFQKRIEVRSIEIVEPSVALETNAQGQTNLGVVVSNLSRDQPAAAGAAKGPASDTGFLIESLAIRAGQFELTGEPVKVDQIDIELRGLAPDRACKLGMGARLFGGKNSRMRLDGTAGPFGANSLPLEGTLALTLAPAEVPAAIRTKELGKLLGAPGDKARVQLEATVKGDLYGTLGGPAKVSLADVMIGKDAQHLLPLSGDVPLTLSAQGLMTRPSTQLKIPKATLRLGNGEWTGDGDVRIRAGAINGSSKGSIRKVEINELASALSDADEKIYGLMEMPSYQIEFAGRNADEVRRSLNGSAKLSLANGRLAALDMMASIQNALEKTLNDAEGRKGSTPFASLASDLAVRQDNIHWSGVLLDSPALRLTGQGVLGFDQSLNFNLDAELTGGVAQLLNRVSRRDAGARSSLPLVLTGTLDSPRVRPNMGKVVKETVRGVLDSLFKKKNP